MAQDVSRVPVHAKVRIRLEISPCGFVVDILAPRQVCFLVHLLCPVRIDLSILHIRLHLVLLLTNVETIKTWKSFGKNTLLEIGGALDTKLFTLNIHCFYHLITRLLVTLNQTKLPAEKNFPSLNFC